MAVKTYSVVEITCDLCGSECAGDDGDIYIEVNGGDRDVGPAYISGRISLTQPYGCVSGDICRKCKFAWLRRYVEDHSNQTEADGHEQ